MLSLLIVWMPLCKTTAKALGGGQEIRPEGDPPQDGIGALCMLSCNIIHRLDSAMDCVARVKCTRREQPLADNIYGTGEQGLPESAAADHFSPSVCGADAVVLAIHFGLGRAYRHGYRRSISCNSTCARYLRASASGDLL